MPRLDMAAGSIATTLASAGAIYSLWVAFFYDGGTASLAPFTIAACVDIACAAFGLHRQSHPIMDFDLLLAALAFVSFAWISSVASLFVGTVLLFREILKHRKRKR